MAGSSVPAAVAYLLSHITTQVNDSTVRIQQGTPGTDQPPDMILIGDVVNRQLVIDTLGDSVNEHYEITLEVSSYNGDDVVSTVFSRAYTLADAVVAVLRADPTLGGAVASCAAEPVIADATVDWDDTGKGRLAKVLFQVTCDAYI